MKLGVNSLFSIEIRECGYKFRVFGIKAKYFLTFNCDTSRDVAVFLIRCIA